MTSNSDDHHVLEELLGKLRESWKSGQSGPTEVPSTLTELLDKTIDAVRSHSSVQKCNEALAHDENQCKGIFLLERLCDLVRFALDSPAKLGASSSRSGELVLNCLRVGLGVAAGSKKDLTHSVLQVAASGARHDKWFVRAAAARVAGEVICESDPSTRLSSILASTDRCWLSALLADEYPEVQQSARAALGAVDAGRTAAPPDKASMHIASAPDPVEVPPIPSWSAASAAAALHAARDLLLSSSSSITETRDARDNMHAQLALHPEKSTRMALQSLRGISSIMHLLPHLSIQIVVAEGFQAVEAWLTTELQGISDAVPWEGEGGPQGQGITINNGISVECRDTIRALASSGVGIRELERAATVAVEEFREECRALNESSQGYWRRGTEWGEDEEGNELRAGSESEKMVRAFRQLYCSLLVRLEAVSSAASQETHALVEGDSPPSGSPHSGSLATEFNMPNAVESRSVLVENLATCLAEVPFAHEQAVPSMEHDSDLSDNQKSVLRRRGHRIRRSIASCAHLVLRTGSLVCERRELWSNASVESKYEEALMKLLVSVFPFEHADTRMENASSAWLSCVEQDLIRDRCTSSPPIPDSSRESQMAASQITEPIPWERCVSGRRRVQRQHVLQAPWAANPQARASAQKLVAILWKRLCLHESSHAVATRNAEAMVRALRASARERGWREGAGVGIKHAVANALRRLRFPLISGATLGHALPLALPLADDYDPAHQAVGFSLMMHLIAEATSTELAWHRGLVLEVVERGFRGGERDVSATFLCLAVAVRLLRRTSKDETPSMPGTMVKGESTGQAGLRLARELLAQAGRTSDGEFRVVVVTGAAALLELPGTALGYASCEILRLALLCLLPILQTRPFSNRVDARASALRALHALCMSCWPRIHVHSAKILCALLWTCGDCSRRPTGARDPRVIGEAESSLMSEANEWVALYATRLGALVLTLSEDLGSRTLREACSALSALRPASLAMQELADSVAVTSRLPEEVLPRLDLASLSHTCPPILMASSSEPR